MGTLITRLRSLSPLGPVFGLELRVTSRRKRTYILRVAYLAGLMLLLLAMHTSMRYVYDTGPVYEAQRRAQMGQVFFATFAWFNLFAMALVGPVLTATAINGERLRKTLPVLLMTPITAWQIVSGKLFSRLLAALTLLGLSLPAVAVVRLLGGVEVEQLLAVLSLCIATVIATAALGLFLSALIPRAFGVILLAYGFLGFIWFLVPLLSGILLFGVLEVAGAEVVFFKALTLLHPFFALTVQTIPDRPPFPVVGWWWCVLLHVSFAAILLVLTALLIRRIARREHEGSAPRPTAPVPPAPALSGMPAVVGPMISAGALGLPVPPTGAVYGDPPPVPSARAISGPPRAVSDNPVLWRELRRPLFSRRWQSITCAAVILGLLLLMYALFGATHHWRTGSMLMAGETHAVLAIGFYAVLTLVVCVISATAIAQEKESDTWTLLLATPVPAGRIVFGKLLGLLRRLVWPCALIVAHFALFTLIGVIHPLAAVLNLWLTLAGNSIWLALGLYFSLRLKSVTFAIILTLLGPVVLYGVVPLVLLIGGNMLAGEDDWAEVVGFYAPVYYMGQTLGWYQSPYTRDGYNRYGGFGAGYGSGSVWMPVIGRVPWSDVFVWGFASGLWHLLPAAGIIYWIVSRFDRIVGRAPNRGAGEATGPPAARPPAISDVSANQPPPASI